MVDVCFSLCFVVAVLPIRTLDTLPTTASDIECRGHGRKYKTIDSDGRLVCKNCYKCPPGQGVSVECTEYVDTVCEPCVAGGTFSGTSSSWRQCEPCSVCATHELTKRECTPTKNRKCGICVIGYFYDDITGDCDRCSWCFPEYPNIADHQDECDVTGVKPGFQCGPIIDPPYPPPLDNMEQSTLAKGESTTTKFMPQRIRTTQSNSKPSKDREKRTSEVYQTSSEFHFVSSRTSPTKWPPPNDTRTTTSAYDRAVLTVQQPIFIATSVNASAVFSTEQYSSQSPVPPTALGVVLAVIVATVLGIFCLYVKHDSKRYEREIHVHMQEPLMEEETSQEVEIVEISTRTETDNSLSAELAIVV